MRRVGVTRNAANFDNSKRDRKLHQTALHKIHTREASAQFLHLLAFIRKIEFTTCGGFKSKGRRPEHDCSKSFVDLLADKNSCYVHDVRGFNYWNITEANKEFFANHAQITHCPFQGGMNQLWRNQLLAMAVEQDDRLPYKHVSFSVVRHPRNESLNRSLRAYQNLIDDNPKFSAFTSADVISSAAAVGDERLDEWVAWYCTLYDLPVPG